jgi:hypothetical protein
VLRKYCGVLSPTVHSSSLSEQVAAAIARRPPLRVPVRRLFLMITPPLAALALAEALLWVVAARGGEDPRRASTWVRWDSYRYVEIARAGYVESSDDPAASNTGWFPGFPGLVRLASAAADVTPARAGRRVALFFEFGLLILIWTPLLPPVSPARRWLALLTAAFFPAWFYRHAVFPLSMTAFFNVAAITLAARRAFLAAGACGAVSAFTYPTGFLVAAPLALGVALTRGLSSRGRLVAALAGPGLAVLGLGAVFGLLHSRVGHWHAFLTYQHQQFGHGLINPLEVLAGHARPLLQGSFEPATLVSLHTVLVTALLLLAAWLLARDGAGRRPVDVLLLTHAAVVWLFVTGVGPDLSVYRPAAVLVGLVPLLARLGAVGLLLLLAVQIALGAGMAHLFFANVLV